MAGDRPKRARAGACQNCRVRKKRCVPGDHLDSCQLCESLSIPCSLSQNPGQHVPSPSHVAHAHHVPTRSFSVREEASPVSKPLPARPDLVSFRERQLKELPKEPPRLEILLTNELALELVSLYFRLIHNVAHTLFHEASFMSRLKQGRAFMVHVYAMCALAARFSRNRVFDDIPPQSRGKGFASTAVSLLQQQNVYASLQTVQACVLLATLLGGEGDSQTKQIYERLARQHAEALSLWVMPDGLNVLDREERRRTWLSVCMADQWAAANVSVEPTPPPALEVLPAVDDVEFHTYHPELLQEAYHPSLSRSSMWAHLTRTLETFTGIRVLLRRLSRGMISFDTYRAELPSWRQRLDQWTKRLPEAMIYNTTNTTTFASQGLGRTFLSMHLGYHYSQQMLYFPLLDTRAAHKTAQQGYGAAQCKTSANMVSEIIQCSTGTKDCELNYYINGNIVMISSCVHLYTLLLGEDSSEVSMARRRLLSNFEYLMRLKLHWPVVDHFVKRLRIFQTLCQNTISDPFGTENWMAQFLSEETSPLSERHASGVDSDDEACIAGPTEKTETNGSLLPKLSQSPATEWGALSSLLNDQNMTSEAFVNNALGWLLE